MEWLKEARRVYSECRIRRTRRRRAGRVDRYFHFTNSRSTACPSALDDENLDFWQAESVAEREEDLLHIFA
jgi:hypothetical protein